jgi:D-arginine dehydrogenase
MPRPTVLVVGAGIAGASTAWHLARSGRVHVVVLEKEKSGDCHSTGRSAAILRTAVEDAETHDLAKKSLAFYQDPPRGFSETPLYSARGVILAADATADADFQTWVNHPETSVGGKAISPQEAQALVPPLADGVTSAYLFPDEGTLDVSAVHQAFLMGAQKSGAKIHYETALTGILSSDGVFRGAQSSHGFFPAEHLVVAAGGWAGTLLDEEGFGLPLVAKRRHLLVTEPSPQVNRNWPVVWIAGKECYFRPESGGLLISACDEAEVLPDQGSTVDSTVLDLLAQKVQRWIPDFSSLGAAHYWAGMRTFSPDGQFVLGPDERLQGLHWAAALGGHGVTCAPAIGQKVAADILASCFDLEKPEPIKSHHEGQPVIETEN